MLGHSWGSTLALELYRQRPDLVRSLVLLGGHAGWAGSLPPDQVERRLQFALRAAELGPNAFDPTSYSALFSDAIPEDRAKELANVMSEIRPAGTRAMAHALAEADLHDVLPHIEVPTLLLYGDADERSPLNVAREIHAAIPGATLTVMPGLGHMCNFESATTVESHVRTFLASLTR